MASFICRPEPDKKRVMKILKTKHRDARKKGSGREILYGVSPEAGRESTYCWKDL